MAKKLGNSSEIYDRLPTLNQFVKDGGELLDSYRIYKIEYLQDWNKYVLETPEFRIWVSENSPVGQHLQKELYTWKSTPEEPNKLGDLIIDITSKTDLPKWDLLVEDDEPDGFWVGTGKVRNWFPIADLKTAGNPEQFSKQPKVRTTRRAKKGD